MESGWTTVGTAALVRRGQVLGIIARGPDMNGFGLVKGMRKREESRVMLNH